MHRWEPHVRRPQLTNSATTERLGDTGHGCSPGAYADTAPSRRHPPLAALLALLLVLAGLLAGAAPAHARTAAIKVLRGNVRWSTSPVQLKDSYQLAAGATLVIDPGVLVELSPGVALYIDGTLLALGSAERPIVLAGAAGRRWEGIFANRGSRIDLQHTNIYNGGAGGTLLASDSGELRMDTVLLTANGGQVRANNSRVDIRHATITQNEMPYGAALEVAFTQSYGAQIAFLLNDSWIANNVLSEGAPALQIANQGAPDMLILDLQRNLLASVSGPDLGLVANGQLGGNITCNTFTRGATGLSIHSNAPPTFNTLLNIRTNAIERHAPPLDPFYRSNNIGRGATSEIGLNLTGNWWGNRSGPYSADRHADGRGDAVSNTVQFADWLTERPACVPPL